MISYAIKVAKFVQPFIFEYNIIKSHLAWMHVVYNYEKQISETWVERHDKGLINNNL